MASYPLRALVLRKTKLGETDSILTLLAADGRQVRAVAKGARKPGSRIGARAEPFGVLDLLLHTGRSLDVIAEARTVAAHDGLRSDYDRTTAAAVVTDVLDKVSVEGQVEPQLFDMALVTLDVLESAETDALRPLVIAFLVKALAMHGYRPVLDACASCACGVAHGAPFSVSSGGVLCHECAPQDPGALPLSPTAHADLRALMRARMGEVAALGVDPASQAELMRALRAYTGYHVPARLKALEFFDAGGPR